MSTDKQKDYNHPLTPTTILIFSFFLLISVLISIVYLGKKQTTSSKAKTISKTPANEISIKYTFTKPTITQSKISPDYSHIEMKDAPNYAKSPGLPNLPMKTAKVVIPYGKKIASISVVAGKKVNLGNYLIEPGQKPYPLLPEDDLKKLYGSMEAALPDQTIYSLNTAYPQTRFDSDYTIQTMKGYNIVLVNLYPVEYYPTTNSLSYYDSITLNVKLDKTKDVSIASTFSSSTKDKKDVSMIIDNKDNLDSYDNQRIVRKHKNPILDRITAHSNPKVGSSPNTITEYVVITRSDFVGDTNNGFTKFIIDKQQGGTSATIVTVDGPTGIYNNYPGRDNPEKIRNFIKDAYTNWNTRYILLGGDADGATLGGESEDPIVPVRYLHNYVDSENMGTEFIASDLYYSCLDGSYDSDNNNVFGEKKDGCDINRKSCQVDVFADVFVGRAPVDSMTEVNNFVRKNISYKYNLTETLHSTYFLGEHMGFGGIMEYSSSAVEQIRLGSNADGYTTQGFTSNPFFQAHTMYDSPNYTWLKEDLISIINSNQIHIIDHYGHANKDHVMKLINKPGEDIDVDNLVNNKYVTIYSLSCYTADFDNSNYTWGDPNEPKFVNFDAIGEHFVTATGAAVALISNTRTGWANWGSTDGVSQRLARQFWHGMFSHGLNRIGELNSFSISQNATHYNDDVYRYGFYSITLLGDPHLAIHTSMPVPTPTPCSQEEIVQNTNLQSINTYCSTTIGSQCVSPMSWPPTLTCHHAQGSWTPFGQNCTNPYCEGCKCTKCEIKNLRLAVGPQQKWVVFVWDLENYNSNYKIIIKDKNGNITKESNYGEVVKMIQTPNKCESYTVTCQMKDGAIADEKVSPKYSYTPGTNCP